MNPAQKQKKLAGRWSKAEQNRFLQGLSKFGKNWVQVQKVVKTRTLTQVRSHAQKVFLKMSEQDILGLMGEDSGWEGSDFCQEDSRGITDSESESVAEVKLQKNQHVGQKKCKVDLLDIFMKAIEDSSKEQSPQLRLESQPDHTPNQPEQQIQEVESVQQLSPEMYKPEEKTNFYDIGL